MSNKIKVIKANTIIIEDLAGRPRIHLDAADLSEFPQITLFSPDGANISIIADVRGCSISIRHPGVNTAACLGVKSDGQSGLELRDSDGRPSITLESKGPNTAPTIEVHALKRRKRSAKPKRAAR